MPAKLTAVVLAFACSAFALAACGSTPKRDVSAGNNAKATPVQAIQEIDIIRKNLLQVSNEVRRSNRKKALTITSDTYADHVEKIEPVLERVSPSLKRKIETGFAQKLRNQLKGNAPNAAIFKLTTLLDNELGQAQVQIKNLK